mmetsp:Transcript_49133/g.55681  ORF Transcript_49133/g.55681 Transcript_49133/m.55681 type:complete len:485 (+) Transcript_49133:221-1675(+)
MAEVGVSGKKTSSPATSSSVSDAPINNGNGSDLFSPTSAAAWALSTLHNFGAAAPNDNGQRPTTDSLTGTRLFKNGCVETKSNNHMTALDASNEYAKVSTQINNSVKTSTSTTYGRAMSGAAAAAHTTTSVTWGQPQFQHPNNSQIVDPSPLVMRNTNELGSSGSAQRQKSLARMNAMTSMVTPTPKKLRIDANGNSSSAYSRKKKSLGVLAENFLNHYKDKPRGSVIVVDDAAVDLGVERRRIYDVVNILESVSLVEKKQKNTYSWMGMDHLDGMFCDLQARAILDYPQDAEKHLGLLDENGKSLSCNQMNPPRLHSRKENKSLAKLSQEFLQVFLVGFETLSLPEASDKIQGTASTEELVAMGGGARAKAAAAATAEGTVPKSDEREMKAAAARGLKTKIRRLYDIANVFLSVGLLKKVENIDTSRRPNFAWNYKLSALDLYKLHQSKKSMQIQSVVAPAYATSTYTENTGLVKARIYENIP